MSYGDYKGKMLYTKEARRLSGIDMFDSKNDLFSEYTVESAEAIGHLYSMGIPLSADHEVEFYILMDYLTYIPFGYSGRAAFENKLKEKNPNDTIADYKMRKSLEVLQEKGIELSEDERTKLQNFFANYDNQNQPLTPAGYATIVRRLSDALSNSILEGKGYASMRKFKDLEKILDEIELDVKQQGGVGFDMSRYCPQEKEIKNLSDRHLSFIEEVMELNQGQPGYSGN